jgi:hypothetical protein
MAIHLNIKIEDPEVEELLDFIHRTHPHADEGDMYGLLNRAADWLRPIIDFRFRTEPNAGDVLSLDFGRIEPASSLPSDTPSQ